MNRLRASFSAACLFAVAALAGAAPLERDLGQGLGYVRVKHLPADLPAAPSGKTPPAVVDVRYLETDAAGATAFLAWLRFRATPRAPVFVLANSATAPVLREALAGRAAGPGVLVVGAPAGRFAPDIAVKGAADDERRAYDALEAGTPVETLLADLPDKVRNDEARLVRGQTSDLADDPPPDNPAARRPPPVIDVALQRAVHLHRSLVALKKL